MPPSIYAAQGCQRCRGSGYRGRIGVFEVAGLDRTLQQAIVDRKSDQAFADLLRELHIPDLQTDALGKVAAGVISYQDAVIVPCVG